MSRGGGLIGTNGQTSESDLEFGDNLRVGVVVEHSLNLRESHLAQGQAG